MGVLESRFDCAALLDWSKAKQISGVQSGYEDNRDQVDSLYFEAPLGSVNELRAWIYSNRLVDTDFEVPWRKYEGTWRVVKIEDKSTPDLSKIVVTIGYGYFTSPDWTAARLATREESPSNDNADVFTVASIDSSDPAKTYRVLFKYVDPKSVESFESAIDESYTNPVVGTQTLTGTFNVLFKTSTIEEDGTSTVVAVLADSKYVLSAYAEYGGVNQQDVVYVWNVPEAIAQDIIDDWKSAHPLGSGVSANYDDKAHLVNIILRKSALLGEELSVSAFDIKCDTTVSYEFAWGLSAAEAESFISDNSTIETQPGVQAKAGVHRAVTTKPRGDGLFDVAIETYYTAYDANKHTFVSEVKSGAGGVITTNYGWEVPIAQLALVEADYNDASVGQRKRLEIRKNEDRCNFSYIGVVEEPRSQVAALATTGETGIAYSVETGSNAALPTGLTSGPRIQYQLSAEKDDSGKYKYSVSKTTTQKAEDSASGGPDGEYENIYAGKNVDSGDLSALNLASGARKRVAFELHPNDDGTFNYVAKEHGKQKVEDSADGGPNGEYENIYVGKNVDAGDLSDLTLASDARKRVAFELYPNDDGTFNYVAKEHGKQEVEDSVDVAPDVYGVGEVVLCGRNVDPGDAQTTIESGITVGKRSKATVQIEANDDGTVNYVAKQIAISGIEGSKEYANASGVSRTKYFGKAADSVPDITASGPRQSVNGEVSGNEDGTVDYSLELESVPLSQLSASAVSSKGISAGIVAGSNATAAEAQSALGDAAAGAKVYDMSVSGNKDGTVAYHAAWRERKEQTCALAAGSTLSTKIITAAKGAASVPSFSVTSGSIVDAVVKIGDDGLFDYVATETVNLERSVSVVAMSSVGPVEISVTIDRVEFSKEPPDDMLSATVGTKVEYTDLSQNEDETYNYTKITTAYSVAAGSGASVNFKSSTVTEKRRETVWTKFFPQLQVVSTIWLDYERDISDAITGVFSVGPGNASGASANQIKETKEIGNGIWLTTTETLEYEDWKPPELGYKNLKIEPGS